MRAVVLFSGGQDSTVCLYWAMANYDEVFPLTITYGQKHEVEVEAARTIVDLCGLTTNHEIIHIPYVLRGGHLLETKSYARGKVADTWVPYRNMLFLTIALNRAVILSDGKDVCDVITGVNQTDYSGYPDCREEFIRAMEKTGFVASERFIRIIPPLIHMSKKEIVQTGVLLEGCMDALAYSHTCYNGESPPCGTCPACILREKGFREAKVKDPLVQRFTHA